MNNFSAFLAILGAVGIAAAQAPAPVAVLNPASNIPAGLPSSGIAQGSIFVIYGSNLGPTTLAQAATLPLPSSAGLSGTSIQVTVGGTTLSAPIVYTSATQVAGVLPSKTPVGTGTISVSYNGQTGSTPISVVKSNFGISTINQTGTGPAVVTRTDYSVISVTNSARAGETLVIWGTGLGPITGDDAATPVPADLGTPIHVYLGTQELKVTYRGRSGFPGLDQINVVVPDISDFGCYVSLLIQTGNTVSNFTSLPVNANGGTCTDNIGLPLTQLNSFLRTGSVRIGQVVAETVTATTPSIGSISGGTTTTSIGAASFYKYTIAQLTQSGSLTGQPSIGSCSLSYLTANSSQGVTALPPVTGAPTGLNAGASITFAGPTSFTMSPVSGFLGSYLASLKAVLPGGIYSLANGTGGPDVGAFSTTISFPSSLTWTNQGAATTVDRTAPFTLTWTGGDPNGYIVIIGTSFTTSTPLLGASFVCTAQIAAGQFTIPAPVLLSLPASQTISAGGFTIPTGILGIESFSNFQKFQATGLDFAYAISGSVTTATMTYK